MKRSWVIRRDDSGVSPVIATILMVAITVVLAAVLYVMVTGLIGGGGTVKPVVTFTGASAQPDGSWKWTVADIDRSQSLASFEALLLANGTTAISSTSLETCETGCGSGLVLTFTDLTGNDNFNGGDFFVLTGTNPDTDYTMNLIWTSTDDVIQTVTFTT